MTYIKISKKTKLVLGIGIPCIINAIVYYLIYLSIVTESKSLTIKVMWSIILLGVSSAWMSIYMLKIRLKKLWRNRCKKIDEYFTYMSPLSLNVAVYFVLLAILLAVFVTPAILFMELNRYIFPDLHASFYKLNISFFLGILGGIIGYIIAYARYCSPSFMISVKSNGNSLEIKLFLPNDSEAEIIYDGEIKVDNYHEFVSCPLRFEGLPNKIKNLKIKAGYFKYGYCIVRCRNCKFLFLRTRGFNLMYFPGVDKDKVLDIMDFFERLSMVSACLYYKRGCTTVPESAIEKIKNNELLLEYADRVRYMNVILERHPMYPILFATKVGFVFFAVVLIAIPDYFYLYHLGMPLYVGAFVASVCAGYLTFLSKGKKYWDDRFLSRNVRRGVVYDRLFYELFIDVSNEDSEDKTKKFKYFPEDIIIAEIIEKLEELDINGNS